MVKQLVLPNLNNSTLFQTASWMTAIVTRPIGSSAFSGSNQTNEDFSAPRTQGEQIKGAVYRTLAGNLKQFADLSCMPKDRSLSRLDEGDGIAAAFFKHRARDDKSCYALFTSTKLKRAQKRKTEAHNEPLAGGKFTRSNTAAYTKDTSPSYFLCESDKQPLH